MKAWGFYFFISNITAPENFNNLGLVIGDDDLNFWIICCLFISMESMLATESAAYTI